MDQDIAESIILRCKQADSGVCSAEEVYVSVPTGVKGNCTRGCTAPAHGWLSVLQFQTGNVRLGVKLKSRMSSDYYNFL